MDLKTSKLNIYLALIRLFAASCINGLKKTSTHTKNGRTYIYLLLLSAFRIEIELDVKCELTSFNLTFNLTGFRKPVRFEYI